jgi:hypothetical protein
LSVDLCCTNGLNMLVAETIHGPGTLFVNAQIPICFNASSATSFVFHSRL